MALVDMKSNLAISKPQPGLEPKIGVDNFPNTNATGFTLKRNTTGLETDYILNDSGGPIIPQTAYLDIKGDFTSIYSPTNKAYPNVYNMDSTQTPLQLFNTPTNNPVDRNGAFLPPYSADTRYFGVGGGITTPITISTNTPDQSDTQEFGFGGAAFARAGAHTSQGPSNQSFTSRLLTLHDRGRTINTGFTRNALSLSEFYAQQPDNFRDIGQRWGDGGINIPFISDTAELAIDIGTSVLSTLASPVFGRDISTFVDSWKASVVRIGANANPLSAYAIKQTVLHRRNPYDRVYSQAMGLGNAGDLVDETFASTTLGELGSLAANSGLLDINPQVYNQASIFSVPGVSGMMFNKNGRNFGDIATFSQTIVENISEKAIAIAAPAIAKFITKQLPGTLGQLAGGIGKAIGGIKIGGTTLSGYKSSLEFTKKLSINKTKKWAKDNLYDRPNSSVDIKGLIEGGKKIRERSEAFLDDVGAISKTQASKLDPRAFEDMGVDKVNLIPYGVKNEEQLSESEALDWIPFRFTDARNNAHIIFRAILSGITDTFSPEYSPERYVGRPDSVYVYQGTSRSISFTFDVYPKSDAELVTLWEKLNYLAGLTYPHFDDTGTAMIAPYTKLTIGDMYKNTPGYISALSYTVQDNTTWEVDFAKLPKYIKVQCSYVYIGNYLPSATQKHFEVPWVGELISKSANDRDELIKTLTEQKEVTAVAGAATEAGKKFLKAVGL
jgi:hypothetical protein